jgi:hypothetical protein
MNYVEWITYGIEQGFCTEPLCQTHEWVPMIDTEMQALDDGDDPCIFIARLGSPEDWLANFPAEDS